MNLNRNLTTALMAIIVAFTFAVGIVYAQHHDNKDMPHKDMDHKVQEQPKGPQVVTIKGHIIDPVCFTQHNSIGPEHKKCAETCAKAGISMAFMDDKDRIYLLIAPNSHESINKLLLEKGLIEENVNVTGIVYIKNGIMSIGVQKIEKAK